MNISMELPAKEAEMIGLGPKKKINPFYQAVTLEQQQKYGEAEKIYRELLNNNFGNVCVQAALGMNLAVQGSHGVANILLSSALHNFNDRFDADLKELGIVQQHKPTAAQPDSFATMKKSEIMNAIGTTWKHENKTTQARYWFERAQKELSTTNADIQNNLATLFINEGHPERAFRHLDAALAVEPEHAQARWNRSLVFLELGDYAQGFDDYRYGKRAQVRMNRNYTQGATPEWDGTPGKVVVVYGEQGIGDEIMFASVLPDLMRDCKQVIFDCHKKLHKLFSNSFPQIDIYPTREDEHITWPHRYPVDAQIAIGDIPRLYRRDIDSFPGQPYLKPTPEANLRWATRMNEVFGDGKPVIGINWIGGHKKTRVEVRSLTLEQMLPILQQDAHFVSLQYTDCADEIAEFEAKHGIKIHHWTEAVAGDDYNEAAGIVANLDLVITCCSSIVHLSGAMGTPCFVLTPSRPAWRYRLDLANMPWYGDTVTLFRQKPDTVDWEPVVEEVKEALLEMTDARKRIPGEPDQGQGRETVEGGPSAESDFTEVRCEPAGDICDQEGYGK